MLIKSLTRHFYSLVIFLWIIERVITEEDDVLEEEDESETTDDENVELDSGPVTEQVMEPNITLNEPSDDDEEEEEEEARELEKEGVDRGFDAKRVIRDLAYYLRAHKFHDFDKRYFTKVEEAKTRLYEEFPRPALRSLHWEAHKNCDNGFYNCLRYANEIVRLTNLRREDDTVTIIRDNKWDLKNNSQQIESVQKECKKSQKEENRKMTPFEGPIDRFRWRTTMSYYMCWYTMLEKPDLEFFGESCANHANCLDDFGTNNRDPRANDDKSFACAMYSFCPDHCCPMKHIWYMKECFQNDTNPCYEENQAADRKCSLNRGENRDFYSLIGNQINVTCRCRTKGFEWSSRFGICVDVNECSRNLHKCELTAGQVCVNLPGSFTCICSLGFTYNEETKSCEENKKIKEALEPAEDEESESKAKNIFEKILKALTRSSAGRIIYSRTFHIFLQLVFIFIHMDIYNPQFFLA